jgi:uncharacterized membrane protein YedE/YeeE
VLAAFIVLLFGQMLFSFRETRSVCGGLLSCVALVIRQWFDMKGLHRSTGLELDGLKNCGGT